MPVSLTSVRDVERELTIASGIIKVSASYHTVDTEGDAPSDDLVTINGGDDGQLLVLRAASDARTVVARDNSGNVSLEGDFSFDEQGDTLTLIYVGALSRWLELSRANIGSLGFEVGLPGRVIGSFFPHLYAD